MQTSSARHVLPALQIEVAESIAASNPTAITAKTIEASGHQPQVHRPTLSAPGSPCHVCELLAFTLGEALQAAKCHGAWASRGWSSDGRALIYGPELIQGGLLHPDDGCSGSKHSLLRDLFVYVLDDAAAQCCGVAIGAQEDYPQLVTQALVSFL